MQDGPAVTERMLEHAEDANLRRALLEPDRGRGHVGRGWLDGVCNNPVSGTPSLDYPILHRATCRSVSELPPRYEHWASAFVKVCADEKGDLLMWSYTETRWRALARQLCDPLAPA
jgi:hypothetical protein